MKKLLIIVIGILVASIAAQSQTKYNLGAGYYGDTWTVGIGQWGLEKKSGECKRMDISDDYQSGGNRI